MHRFWLADPGSRFVAFAPEGRHSSQRPPQIAVHAKFTELRESVVAISQFSNIQHVAFKNASISAGKASHSNHGRSFARLAVMALGKWSSKVNGHSGHRLCN